MSRHAGPTLFITDDGMTFGAGAPVEIKLVGVAPSAPRGERELRTRSNFFIGDDTTTWRTNVRNYAQVRAKNWLPGVDVVWHAGDTGIEFDLDVAAGVDARRIALDVSGAKGLAVRADGALEISTEDGMLVERPPLVIQSGHPLRARYRVDGTRVAFAIDDYDSATSLLIDPVLDYSTYLGGSEDDEARSIAVDAAGDAYVAGLARSIDFPTKNPVQSANDSPHNPNVAIAKLDASGSSLVYSTYLGGNAYDYANSIAVDGAGNAYVAGAATSSTFPTTPNVLQTTLGGLGDGFVAKLDSNGALVYSTFVGGTGSDLVIGLALDASHNAYLTGWTDSSDFPTKGAIQTGTGTSPSNFDAFVAKLDSTATTLIYSTYVAGGAYDEGDAIAVDSTGAAYVVGRTASSDFPTSNALQANIGGGVDAFVMKLNPAGSALAYSTFLGGAGEDVGRGVAVDQAGNAYVAGYTRSNDFPVQSPFQSFYAGGYDGFVTKLDAAGATLVYSTYLGGAGDDAPSAIAIDASGNAYVSGDTSSSTFPLADAIQNQNAGGFYDTFVTKLDSTGTQLLYSTYLGGSSTDMSGETGGIAVDGNGNAYVTGNTQSTDFPTHNPLQAANAGSNDLFISKITFALTLDAATVPPKGTAMLVATGGTSAGYVYSIQTNASGATINASTGEYVAGATGGVIDVVEVTDSASHTATANVTVGPGVSITPSNVVQPPKGSVGFVATGGSGAGFDWSLAANESGATIDSSTGFYVAGAVSGVTDTVAVADSLGNTATATVVVSEDDAASGTDSSPGGDGSPAGTPNDSGGCGCRTSARGSSTATWLCVVGALVSLALRRRRARGLRELPRRVRVLDALRGDGGDRRKNHPRSARV